MVIMLFYHQYEYEKIMQIHQNRPFNKLFMRFIHHNIQCDKNLSCTGCLTCIICLNKTRAEKMLLQVCKKVTSTCSVHGYTLPIPFPLPLLSMLVQCNINICNGAWTRINENHAKKCCFTVIRVQMYYCTVGKFYWCRFFPLCCRRNFVVLKFVLPLCETTPTICL